MIRLVKTKSQEAWNQINQQLEGSPFHTWEWLSLLKRIFGVEIIPFVIYADSEVVGLFPLIVQKKAFLKFAVSPLQGWATPYLGPIIDEEKLPLVLEALNSFLLTNGVSYCEVTADFLASKKIFKEQGFVLETFTTLVLDLYEDDSEQWGVLQSRARNMVRKARNNGIQIIECTSKGFLKEYYEMAKDVYVKVNRLPPISKEMHECLWDIFNSQGNLKILFAKHKNCIIAAGFFLLFGKKAYYWDGVSYAKYNHLAPNNLIQWEFIRWAGAHGYKTYDLLGAGNPSIRKFKESFGAREHQYVYFYKCLGMPAFLLRNIYSRMAPLIRSLQWKMSTWLGYR